MAITVEDKNLGHATAYAYAKSKGYAGTEEEFAEDLKKSAEYADNAAASATSAATSATNAANSATAAGNAQTAAESAKTAAQSAQTAAESAKTSAQSSATSAGNSATAASGSASNASASASSAASSASSASSSASSASASATAAGNSATSAGTSATNAAGSATNAASSATAASGSATDAQNAKTAAQNAQTAAEAARDAAQGYAESIDPNTLAKKDGTYEDLTSGNAEQLLSSVYTDNSEPYLFRKTGGNGQREYLDKIVGGSLVVNQYAYIDTQYWSNQNVMSSVSSGEITVTSSSDVSDGKIRYMNLPTINHVWLMVGDVKSDGATEATLGMYKETNAFIGASAPTYYTGTTYTRKYAIAKPTVASDRAALRLRNSTPSGGYATYKNIQLFDLTKEFGSDIADHVLALEQSGEGVGVNWLRQYMDFDTYRPRTTGTTSTLKHVEGLQSHDTVEFNQWDEEWEPGGFYTSTGLPWTTDTRIRSKNFIPVLPDTRYHILIPYGENSVVLYYDSSKQFISTSSVGNGSIFTTPINARYIMFNTGASYVTKHGLNYNHDICINFSSAITNGTYEPYQKRSYPLDSSVVLRGVPTLVDGRLKFDGDEYLANGTINRRYGYEDLGTWTWSVTDPSKGLFWVLADTHNIKKDYASAQIPHIVMRDYVAISYNYYATNMQGKTAEELLAAGNKTIWVHPSNWFGICDSAFVGKTVEEVKAMLSGVYLVYEKATPTTETAEPFRQLQICDTYGTEEFVTTSEIPVGTETRYPEDLKAKVEGLPWDLSMIAPIENGTTASRAYTAGQYFLHNNVFCKALTSIASGATFTLNTNYTETTIAAELYTALH